MDSQENANFDIIVDALRGLNIDATKFKPIINQHIENLHEYFTKEESGAKLFENRESYEAFCVAYMALSKVKHMVWSSSIEDISDPDEYKGESIPPLLSFHYTRDEKEMQKILDYQDIQYGDVLHLQIVDDDKDKFKLHILNKYGEAKRIADSMLYADLIKDNPLVKLIVPPLKKSDLVRAVLFENIKFEVGVYKSRLISFNSKFVKDPKLKDLKLGRVFKNDVHYYPEDISEYHSLGEYLEKNDPFENPKQIRQHTEALGVDPLKTGPFFDVKKSKHVPCEAEVPEFDYMAVINKTREAEKLLSDGLLKEAYEKINESLSLFSEDSRALTVKGKILLATAEVVATVNAKTSNSEKIKLLKKQAYLSFVDALKINCLNSEAANFHDAILKQAILLNPSMAKEMEPHVLKPNYVDPLVEEFKEKFKIKNLQKVETVTAEPTVGVKMEPLNV